MRKKAKAAADKTNQSNISLLLFLFQISFKSSVLPFLFFYIFSSLFVHIFQNFSILIIRLLAGTNVAKTEKKKLKRLV